MITTTEILRELIAQPTVSRQSNLALLDYVEGLLTPLGIQVERFMHESGTRGNLWATVGPDAPGGIVLSGHTDVVPVEGQNRMSDPFVLTERDGRLYGRGTADMKGFVASAIRAVMMAAEHNLHVPLHLALSYDEEIGCMGVRSMIDALALRSERPSACIVGEPTSLQIATGHKGKIAARATCHGCAGHSALAPDALNALHLGASFIGAMQARQDELRQKGARDEAYEVPYSTIHAGMMHGGTALNIVPNLAQIDFEIRNIAQDSVAEILDHLRQDAIAISLPYRNQFPDARIEVEEVSGYPGLNTDPASTLVALLRRLMPQAQLRKVAFGTEAGLFTGRLGMPTVVCGPGNMAQGHKPDEYVSIDQLVACDALLEAVISECEPHACRKA